MRDWIVPFCSLLGVFATPITVIWANGRAQARRDGVIDEKIKVANARIYKIEDAVDDQGQRIATIEGQLAGVMPGHRR